MSFLYPRTIAISRTAYVNTSGGGLEPGDVAVASGIPASIQIKKVHPVPGNAMLIPAGTASNPGLSDWKIIFNQPLGTVQKGDKITDDLGMKYEVDSPYWNSLGYQCECRIYKP